MLRSQENYDVVIVGGGIVGLAFAALLPATLKIAIIEQQNLEPFQPQENNYDLRVSAINLASQKIFQKINAWQTIEQLRISPFTGMKIWDGSGNGEINFDSLEMGEAQLGYIIENRVLQTALLAELQKKSLDIISNVQIQKMTINQQEVKMQLQNGRELITKLVVGADGANSWVREQAGIELKQWPYYQQALVTTVKTELPHHAIARQRFFDNAILAFLPLADPHYCSIVWSTSTDEAKRLSHLNDDDFNNAITKAFADKLGAVQKLAACKIFPLTMRHAKNYVQHRIALIGDAAHTIHPLAGQGLNLGLQDAVCLANIITSACLKERDVGYIDTLRRYERARKGDNLLMIAMMEGFKRLFGAHSGTLIHLRNSGLNFVDRSKLLKNFFMRKAVRE